MGRSIESGARSSGIAAKLECCKSTALEELEVVVLDCQTTGATPVNGSVLEIAWCRTSAAAPTLEDVHSSLVALPEGRTIPSRVTRITGIADGDLADAPREEAIVDEIEASLDGAAVHVVAHFARFERDFLEDLLSRFGRTASVLTYLCTYEIARRLYPDLPRHSLRALAGFLGYPLREKRRAAEHVRATAHIWKAVVTELRERQVETRDDIERFLDVPPPPRNPGFVFPMGAEKRRPLPDSPGVYRFLDRNSKVLYVGKAKSLKRRIGSYFHGPKGKALHIKEMLAQAYDVAFETTQTALEAALAEVDKIKKIDPPYNRSLRQVTPDVYFYDRDFTEASPSFDDEHRCGPFSRPETVQAFVWLTRFLGDQHGWQEELPAQLSGPDEAEILYRNEALLRSILVPRKWRETTPHTVLALGAIWWLHRRQKTRESGDRKASEQSEAAPLQVVASRLTGIASRAAHQLFRANWFRLLAQSTLVWELSKNGDTRRAIVLDESRLLSIFNIEQGDAVPLRSHEAMTTEWPEQFSRDDYDRMRVLTTELSRVVADGRKVAIHFGGRATLRGAPLVDVLKVL